MAERSDENPKFPPALSVAKGWWEFVSERQRRSDAGRSKDALDVAKAGKSQRSLRALGPSHFRASVQTLVEARSARDFSVTPSPLDARTNARRPKQQKALGLSHAWRLCERPNAIARRHGVSRFTPPQAGCRNGPWLRDMLEIESQGLAR